MQEVAALAEHNSRKATANVLQGPISTHGHSWHHHLLRQDAALRQGTAPTLQNHLGKLYRPQPTKLVEKNPFSQSGLFQGAQ